MKAAAEKSGCSRLIGGAPLVVGAELHPDVVVRPGRGIEDRRRQEVHRGRHVARVARVEVHRRVHVAPRLGDPLVGFLQGQTRRLHVAVLAERGAHRLLQRERGGVLRLWRARPLLAVERLGRRQREREHHRPGDHRGASPGPETPQGPHVCVRHPFVIPSRLRSPRVLPRGPSRPVRTSRRRTRR